MEVANGTDDKWHHFHTYPEEIALLPTLRQHPKLHHCAQWAQWGIDTLGQDLPRDARTLLGPNEPNHHLQANLTPEAAAALWPELQKVALPAVVVTAEKQFPVCCWVYRLSRSGRQAVSTLFGMHHMCVSSSSRSEVGSFHVAAWQWTEILASWQWTEMER